MISKQPATGCFNEEVAGTSGSDVHVIDLQSAEEGGILDDNISSDNHEDIATESEENGSESFDDEFIAVRGVIDGLFLEYSYFVSKLFQFFPSLLVLYLITFYALRVKYIVSKLRLTLGQHCIELGVKNMNGHKCNKILNW